MIHGKYTTYNNHGCRCDPCRADAAAYMRAWRARNPGRSAVSAAAWRGTNRQRELLMTRDRQQAAAELVRRHRAEYRRLVGTIRRARLAAEQVGQGAAAG